MGLGGGGGGGGGGGRERGCMCGCVYQLLSIYDDFVKSFDSEITTQVIFFDISKAFDKVWHRGLLRKLHAIRIRSTLLHWFENYLAERK